MKFEEALETLRGVAADDDDGSARFDEALEKLRRIAENDDDSFVEGIAVSISRLSQIAGVPADPKKISQELRAPSAS